MEKKFYEMPEVEVIDLQMNGAILLGSDPNKPGVSDEEGDSGDLG